MLKDLGVFVVAFACGFGAGYIAGLDNKPTAACRCVPPPGLNTGAVIGEAPAQASKSRTVGTLSTEWPTNIEVEYKAK